MDINDFLKLAEGRYSIRRYAEKDVPREVLMSVMEAARIAPSAVNFQPWKFFIASGKKAKEMVCASYNREWIATAPLYIIACGDHSVAWHRSLDNKDHTDIDIAIAVEHICLSAAAAGLGTCWVCNFDAAMIKREMNLPENLEPIAIIPIGYPEGDGGVRPKKRKDIEDIIQWLEE